MRPLDVPGDDFDPAESFAMLLGYFREHAGFVDRVDLSRWRRDPELVERSGALAAEITRTGVVSARQIFDAMSRPSAVFTLLMAIDQAFLRIDPRSGGHERGRLGRHRQTLWTTGFYYAHPERGYVLPRRGYPARPLPVPDDVADYFRALMVVPEMPHDVRLDVIPEEVDFDEKARERIAGTGTIVVGCVPFMTDISELEMTAVDDADPWYSITIRERPGNGGGVKDWSGHWQERIRAVLHRLDRSGAHVGVLPELSLTDDLLAYWRWLLPRTPRPKDGDLQWIMAGTGPLDDGHGDDRRPNRAVLLHRRTGAIVVEQDKCDGFTMTEHQIRAWQLLGLEPGPRAEWMREGRSRIVFDAAAGRFSIAVCEDLNRLLTTGARLAALGPTHLIVPIFAPPIQQDRWQHDSGARFAHTTGSATVVANSRALANGLPVSIATGTALAVRPIDPGPSKTWWLQTDIKDVASPAGVAVFHLPRS